MMDMNEKPEDTRAVAAHEVATVNEDVRLAVYIREIEAQAGALRSVRAEQAKAKKAAEAELEKCRSRISSLESEVGGLGRTLEGERKASRVAQDRFLDEIKNARECNGSLIARLEDLEVKKAEVVADNARLVSENARLAEELATANGRADALASAKNRAEELSASLSATQDRLLAEVEGVRKSNGVLVARLESMGAEKESAVADNARLVSENARLAEELATANGRADALASAKNRAEELSASLSATQDRLLAEVEGVRKSNGVLVARLESMGAEKESAVADNARLVSENARLVEELATANGRAYALSSAKNRAEELSASLSATQERLLAEVDGARERSDALMTRLEAMETKKEEVVADNARLVAENVHLSEDLAEAKGRADDLSAALSAAREGSAQLKLKADLRFAEIAVLKERLKKAQAAEVAAKGKAEFAGKQLAAANKALRECREREDARRFSRRLRRFARGIMPYGLVCMWKRMAYGIVEDKPLFYYPGFFNRAKRVLKFLLPYFAVTALKRSECGRRC